MKACRDCHRIPDNDAADKCPSCGGGNLSKDWSGYVVVVNVDKSVIAQKMQIDQPGKYALKVR